jgi:3-hydroxyisobutyrate dehydrogenase
MARHLKTAGHDLTVEDLSQDRVTAAIEAGLRTAAGPAAIGEAEVVLSSLPHDEALWRVAQELALHARPGTTFIDTSTVSPAMSSRVAGVLQERSILYLRSTVSGNNMMADAAQLTLLVSGPKDAYERMIPLLSCLGPTRYWLGDAEQSRLMKLVVNLMIAQTSAMLGEALTLGSKGGLRWEDMWEVLTHSAVASPILNAKSKQLSQRDFTPTFTVSQMTKDVGLILSEAQRLQVSLVQTAMTLQLLQSAAAHGDAEADYAAVIRCVERAAGMS